MLKIFISLKRTWFELKRFAIYISFFSPRHSVICFFYCVFLAFCGHDVLMRYIIHACFVTHWVGSSSFHIRSKQKGKDIWHLCACKGRALCMHLTSELCLFVRTELLRSKQCVHELWVITDWLFHWESLSNLDFQEIIIII